MATINAWPATETTKSNTLFGRFIRLFSSIPAERFAECVSRFFHDHRRLAYRWRWLS